MNILELVHFIKSSDDRTCVELIHNLLDDMWIRGWNRRDHVAKLQNGFRYRQKLRHEEELEILVEKYSKMGYFGTTLDELVQKELMLDQKP